MNSPNTGVIHSDTFEPDTGGGGGFLNVDASERCFSL